MTAKKTATKKAATGTKTKRASKAKGGVKGKISALDAAAKVLSEASEAMTTCRRRTHALPITTTIARRSGTGGEEEAAIGARNALREVRGAERGENRLRKGETSRPHDSA